jgi:hypothetical protein
MIKKKSNWWWFLEKVCLFVCQQDWTEEMMIDTRRIQTSLSQFQSIIKPQEREISQCRLYLSISRLVRRHPHPHSSSHVIVKESNTNMAVVPFFG